MTDLMTDLKEVLKAEVPQRHSFFQLKYFVLGKEYTHQSRLYQALRELKSRHDSLRALDLEIEDCQDQIQLSMLKLKELKARVEPKTGEMLVPAPDTPEYFKQARTQIELRQTKRQHQSLEHHLGELVEKKHWIEQEAMYFLEWYKAAIKIEPLKDFDDLESQKEYWNQRLSSELNYRRLVHASPDVELMKTILALPQDINVKKVVLAEVNKMQQKLTKMQQDSQSAGPEK